MPEFVLTTPDNVNEVTAASIEYKVQNGYQISSTTLELTSYIGIDYRPTALKDADDDETNYAKCANPSISLTLNEEDEETFGLGSYDRGKIKDRCNAASEDDEWYAVGYRLYNESYSTKLIADNNKLYFTYN